MRLIISSFFIIQLITTIAAVDFKCYYKSEDFPSYGFAYSCALTEGIVVTKTDVEVKSIDGYHFSNKTDTDVTGFLIFYKLFNHFPRRVTKYFQNIKVVSVEYSQLKEIHKEDLRQFGGRLIDLGLEGNEIVSIEKDLFMFNPNLKYISLISNKIKTISENVFDNLNGLLGINLIDNNCINYVYYGREIRDFVRSIKLKCNENFSSKDIRIPVIVTKVDYDSYLVKLLKLRIQELELKLMNERNQKCSIT